MEGYQRDYDITPDGTKLLLVFPAADPDGRDPHRERVHVVVNWIEELKERVSN